MPAGIRARGAGLHGGPPNGAEPGALHPAVLTHLCPVAATRFGQGVYFAVKAVLSVQEMYSPPSADGNKYIFVVKALTGEFTVGTPDMRVPPLREGPGMPRRYDSVVDNRSQPALFVIFNDTQAYPQYLITCQRCQAPAPV